MKGKKVKKLIEIGNGYVKQADWTDFALVKLCLCAMGIMIGCAIPARKRKCVAAGAVAVFSATYLPLLFRLVKVLLRRDGELPPA